MKHHWLDVVVFRTRQGETTLTGWGLFLLGLVIGALHR